jgi:small GTP-binding protein
MSQDGLTVRVVLIGDSQVGKTSLIHRFVRSSFERQQKSTIGAVFHTYEQTWKGRQVIMQIWDTAGQEKYRSLGPIYYRNSAAGIAVFDLTSKETLPGLEKWITEFKKYTEEPLLFIVGNKSDLDGQQAIQRDEAEEFAKQQGATPFFTSAKTGDQVKELFDAVFNQLAEAGKIGNDENKLEANEGGGCC